MYQIIDKQTQLVQGTRKTYNAARKQADKLDSNYGGYRFFVKEIIA